MTPDHSPDWARDGGPGLAASGHQWYGPCAARRDLPARASQHKRRAAIRRMRSGIGRQAMLDSHASASRRKSSAGGHEAMLEPAVIGVPCVDEAILR